ncbi:Fic family protein [Actinobacillus ureae ATCC 25976]|uniref:protein adenylyltransferase n=1 Tax=Actinobacillus ureae ATCC 25976 TaxID=887324 RepID=E8KET6_9PAST|nr:Fic family protein [Actinobacillus ureae]EFX92594.1 Fic family protein [Actinobacillus ureae ATCC 25976]
MKYAELDRYTDKNGVLFNNLNAKTEQELEEKESRIVALQSIKLRLLPVEGNFDLAHLQEIHRRLFNDIYEWAGEIRDVGITKGKTVFASPHRIQPEFAKLYKRYQNEAFLLLSKLEVANKLAYYLSEINILHPFREGNGRVQREFIIQLAQKFGYRLHFNGVSQQEMILASEKSALYCDNSLLEKIILARLEPNK